MKVSVLEKVVSVPAAEKKPATAAPAKPGLVIPVSPYPRSAWVEIDLGRFKRNFELIQQDRTNGLEVISVIKDEAYGHGALAAARAALAAGIRNFALSTVEEAMALRDAGIESRLLLLGDRPSRELPWCVAHDLTCCIGEAEAVAELDRLAVRAGKRVPVHLKINTGMNRYGARWDRVKPVIEAIRGSQAVYLEGVMSHFAQSDEADKTFALLQLSHFKEALNRVEELGMKVPCRHMCNSGGFLDLPQARFDMVRLGILPLGVFPSSVCRRIAGIEPVMTVKARIAGIQKLEPGDCVGYGMRYTASSVRRIGVLPIGYGDGFPRVRNEGWALIHGRRAPLVGGVSMDAITVDITDIPEAELWDEAVVMGRQEGEEITANEVAKLKHSISYDILTNWRSRLPRVYVGHV